MIYQKVKKILDATEKVLSGEHDKLSGEHNKLSCEHDKLSAQQSHTKELLGSKIDVVRQTVGDINKRGEANTLRFHDLAKNDIDLRSVTHAINAWGVKFEELDKENSRLREQNKKITAQNSRLTRDNAALSERLEQYEGKAEER